MMKHCLIIPCAEPKLGGKRVEAYEMYLGYMMEVMKQYSKEEVLSAFNVFFLSAQYGLIHSNTLIDDYDARMSKVASEQLAFAKTHKAKATKLLNKYLDKKSNCYVILSKDYLSAWTLMDVSTLAKFNVTYTHLISRGSGDNRGCLKSILEQKINNNKFNHTFFKSGVANENEFVGVRNSGSYLGTSLAHIGLGKVSAIQHITEELKSNKSVFLDNGLITAFNKGKKLDVSDIFYQYIALVKSLKVSCKTLSIVVPDAPYSQTIALNSIKKHIKEIKWLAKRCNVLIAFHKPIERTVKEQVGLVHELLGDTPFTAAFPCRKKGVNDWRLSIADIESALRYQVPNTKDYWIKRVHFFALGESSGKACAERLDLVERYGITCQLDVSRFTALFAKKEKPRAGNVAAKRIANELTDTFLIGEKTNVGYDVEDENMALINIKKLQGKSRDERVALWDDIFPKVALDENNNTKPDPLLWVETKDNKTGFEEFDSKMDITIFYRKRFTFEVIVKPSSAAVRSKVFGELFKEDNLSTQQVFSFALIDTKQSLEDLGTLKMAEKNGRLIA